MIKPISFTLNNTFVRKNLRQLDNKYLYLKKPVCFQGIMDDSSSKRITDANGNTYVIEAGGTLVINNDKKEKNGVPGTATGVGAGAIGGAAVTKGSSSKNTKINNSDPEDLNAHEIKQKTETTETESNTCENTDNEDEISKDLDDISETDYDDSEDVIDIDNDSDIEDLF